MKRVKKLSQLKRDGYVYKGEWIQINFTYIDNKYNTTLMYCPLTENELYFTAGKFAKRYLDSVHHMKKLKDEDFYEELYSKSSSSSSSSGRGTSTSLITRDSPVI